MLIETNLKPKNYNPKEIVRITDDKQFKKYIKHRVFPIDIYPSVDNYGNDITVYIFLKSETKEVYMAWKNKELN